MEQHNLRVLIDEAATLRGLTIQMSLRLMSLAAAPDDTQRQDLQDEFQVLFAQFQANMDMLFGTSPPPPEHRDHVAWMRQIAGANAQRRALLLDVEHRIRAVAQSLDAGHVPTFVEARGFFDAHWPIVRDKLTEVIWDLWADLDARKTKAIDENAALKVTLQKTLADIKLFSAAIRMIAINTAVLATRPQDAGTGFQVISNEVKRLSEDIDASTNRANDALSELL
ncbi:hypothetical protein [Tateyamaria sp. SN3-11]|uniref:hypothetical protein n=1 Tax=Tateyamaria sp. SN3-11 TaxID=3092147 RepID=UPI0039E9EA25